MEKISRLQNHPILLTVPEAAEQLRVSKWTIYQLIRANELKTLTIGTRRFVACDDLAKYINERKAVTYEAT
jgi:excisionase family DNA binding protein